MRSAGSQGAQHGDVFWFRARNYSDTVLICAKEKVIPILELTEEKDAIPHMAPDFDAPFEDFKE